MDIAQLCTFFKASRRNAKTCKIPWDLSLTDLQTAYARSGGRCEVTHIRFLLDAPENGRRRPWAPSIDRVDSSLGYTASNIRLVCVAANYAMNIWGDEVLHKMVESMEANRKTLGIEAYAPLLHPAGDKDCRKSGDTVECSGFPAEGLSADSYATDWFDVTHQ